VKLAFDVLCFVRVPFGSFVAFGVCSTEHNSKTSSAHVNPRIKINDIVLSPPVRFGNTIRLVARQLVSSCSLSLSLSLLPQSPDVSFRCDRPIRLVHLTHFFGSRGRPKDGSQAAVHLFDPTSPQPQTTRQLARTRLMRSIWPDS
jgi:hypothetical protein